MAKHRRVVVVAIAIAACAAIGGGLVVRQHWQERSFQAETIRIGYAIEAPYAFLKPNGEVTGESPEVAREIVARLGIGRVDWVQANFDALIPGLEARRFDVIAAGMFITPERARRVAFSEPSFLSRYALLVRRGNPQRLISYESAISHSTAKIAVLAGAIEGEVLRRLGLPQDRLVVVPDALTGRAAVATGLADGLALSSPTVRWMAEADRDGSTEMAQPFEQPRMAHAARLGFGGFVFRQQDVALRKAWNDAMTSFIGSAAHQALIAGFGFTADELPGAITTKELLAQ